ncbi:hydrolase [Rhizobium sp. Leaf371]|uniref:carbon-nitrogen hydrolase family protein n=1 Tax=Rhizobium sp. Leaf371 TaxID=1736355 RepID=UPI000714F301|nr:carbon-nitrogen hydrolase family protein [Rhizobium sp. Leaf371]KQS72439.1 hydrolase [Rhizobium sp. Leaf371]
MSTKTFRVALAQVLSDADIDAVITSAADTAADLIVFPEMFSNGYSKFDPRNASARASWLDGAVDLQGAFIETFRVAARRAEIAVVATFLEKAEPKPFNAAVLIDRNGDIVLHQRKRHICFFDVPEEACAPGDSSSVSRLDTRCGPVSVGIMICMDREFPDVASDLVRAGAEIVLVPNSSPLVDDVEVGDIRVAGVRAMAFQSVIGVAVANYPEPKDDGHSFAVGASGQILAMGGKQQAVVYADFDLDDLKAARDKEWFRRVR